MAKMCGACGENPVMVVRKADAKLLDMCGDCTYCSDCGWPFTSLSHEQHCGGWQCSFCASPLQVGEAVRKGDHWFCDGRCQDAYHNPPRPQRDSTDYYGKPGER